MIEGGLRRLIRALEEVGRGYLLSEMGKGFR
jgi:hypothetical protein